jgi:hypothetical protein
MESQSRMYRLNRGQVMLPYLQAFLRMLVLLLEVGNIIQSNLTIYSIKLKERGYLALLILY